MGSLFNFNPIIQSENHATNKGKTALGAKMNRVNLLSHETELKFWRHCILIIHPSSTGSEDQNVSAKI